MNQFTVGTKVFLIALAHFLLFALASVDKLISGLPPWFVVQVNKTLLARFPGGPHFQFYAILALELLVAIGCFLSLLRMEFLPDRTRPVLKISLLLSMFTFIVLGSGQRIFAQWGGDANSFQGASNSFSYFGVSLLCLLMIQKD